MTTKIFKPKKTRQGIENTILEAIAKIEEVRSQTLKTGQRMLTIDNESQRDHVYVANGFMQISYKDNNGNHYKIDVRKEGEQD